MGAAVITGCDPAPVFDAAEGVLDAVSLPIEVLVKRDGRFTAWYRGDTSSDATLRETGAKVVAVVAAIGQQHAGGGQARQQQGAADMITPLAFGEQQDDRPSMLVADRVQLGVQTALGTTDAPRDAPFCRRLAAVRWAFR